MPSAPLKVGRFAVTIDIIVAVVMACVVALGIRACTPDTPTDVHLANAHMVSLRLAAQRDSLRKAMAEADRRATATGRQGERVSVAVQTVEVLLRDTLRVPVRDTALERAAEDLTMQVTAYMDSVHDERMARLNERMAWQSASASQDSLIAAWQGAYHAEHARRWRYRGEGGIVGLIIALTLVVVL